MTVGNVKWCKPNEGVFKINTDAAIRKVDNLVGVCAVIMDFDGKVLFSVVQKIDVCYDLSVMEVVAILMGQRTRARVRSRAPMPTTRVTSPTKPCWLMIMMTMTTMMMRVDGDDDGGIWHGDGGNGCVPHTTRDRGFCLNFRSKLLLSYSALSIAFVPSFSA
ncbi:hypothetical protein LWI28_026832 [Acer negundo]|uniref:RNase H type-1 domain-containing protein n=1 Tax=Acer negundo TaxID=4023 RepID=A0AAD5IGE4_ACENE|nr:hypothetical protein LWI28_026832 [Acer negundo]